MQLALCRPGQLERFLSADEAAMVRRVLPEQWCLHFPAELEEARQLVHQDAAGFVAKNVLRPRTGSGVTQVPRASVSPSTLSLKISLKIFSNAQRQNPSGSVDIRTGSH